MYIYIYIYKVNKVQYIDELCSKMPDLIEVFTRDAYELSVLEDGITRTIDHHYSPSINTGTRSRAQTCF